MPANFHCPSLSGSAQTSKTGADRPTDRPMDRNGDYYMALGWRASAIKTIYLLLVIIFFVIFVSILICWKYPVKVNSINAQIPLRWWRRGNKNTKRYFKTHVFLSFSPSFPLCLCFVNSCDEGKQSGGPTSQLNFIDYRDIVYEAILEF